MTTSSARATSPDFWSRLFSFARRDPGASTRRRHRDSYRVLETMSLDQLADLPSLHEAAC